MQKSVKVKDGTKISYIYKKGKRSLSLVFLHGVGANHTVWKKEVNYFEKKGYPTIALDFRGHGKSGICPRDDMYCAKHFCSDVHAVLKKEKIKDFILIGHSLGGAVAINYCTYYKKRFPKGMILLETSYYYPFPKGRFLRFSPFVRKIMDIIAGRESLTEKYPHLSNIDFSKRFFRWIHVIPSAPIRVLIDCLHEMEKVAVKRAKIVAAVLTTMAIPVLVIGGSKDKLIPMNVIEDLHDEIKGAELKIIEKGTHLAVYQRSREVSKFIDDFLNRKFK